MDTAAACSDHAACPSLFLPGSSKQSQTRLHSYELLLGLCHIPHNQRCFDGKQKLTKGIWFQINFLAAVVEVNTTNVYSALHYCFSSGAFI